ncbi:hypothetical protein WR25_13073 [Diploscapter pachys]|uniref:Uncharacterized protein n=1 Tax=Diploscapter pachys TaxID=2018661 RepID=A0A2A2KW66_9BILA|nr:hypothetical protein WR25_13073 [Diploscapter pachys]
MMSGAEQATKTRIEDDPGYRDSFLADNPITGQPSCPIGFESVLLYESDFTHYFKEKSWLGLDQELVWNGNVTAIRVRNADKDVSFRLHRNCRLYWCKRDRNLPPPKDSDIALFGGVYTGFRDDLFVDNPITGQPSCPIGFESVLLYAKNTTVYAKDKFLSGLDYELVWDDNVTAIGILNEDKNVSFRIHRNYGVYWCKRDRSLPPPKDSDIALFGGVYTDQIYKQRTILPGFDHAYTPATVCVYLDIWPTREDHNKFGNLIGLSEKLVKLPEDVEELGRLIKEMKKKLDKVDEVERKSAESDLKMTEVKKELVEMRRIIESAQRQNEQRNKDIEEAADKRIRDASLFLLSPHRE